MVSLLKVPLTDLSHRSSSPWAFYAFPLFHVLFVWITSLCFKHFFRCQTFLTHDAPPSGHNVNARIEMKIVIVFLKAGKIVNKVTSWRFLQVWFQLQAILVRRRPYIGSELIHERPSNAKLRESSQASVTIMMMNFAMNGQTLVNCCWTCQN